MGKDRGMNDTDRNRDNPDETPKKEAIKFIGELWPTKKQWGRWSLPSKLSAMGALFGLITIVLWLMSQIPIFLKKDTTVKVKIIYEQIYLVEIKKGYIEVYNKQKEVLWTRKFKGKIVKAVAEDIDGDGLKEVIVGVGGRSEDSGKIVALNAKEEVIWKYLGPQKFNYIGGKSDKLSVNYFEIASLFAANEKQIVALYRDSQGWYQSCIVVIDSKGKLRSIYWHPGHLHKVAIGSKDGNYPLKIFLGGPNNDLTSRYQGNGFVYGVGSLNPADISGEAPPYYGKARKGSEDWYGVILPRGQSISRLEILDHNDDNKNEICIWTSMGHIFYLDFSGRVIGKGLSDGTKGEAEFRVLR